MQDQRNIIGEIQKLLNAYQTGKLGDTTMPEDTYPMFKSLEEKKIYYTLPMALNYQRNSYKLWEAAKKTHEDKNTAWVFNLNELVQKTNDELRLALLKYKLALQPNKHIDTWSRISKVLHGNWGSVTKLIEDNNSDYLLLRDCMQKDYKKNFPYLSGPKIFNYWVYIMSEYGEVDLRNRSYIEIAPDTHVLKASVRLGVLTEEQAGRLSREEVSKVWRELLQNSGVDPIDMHSPLWFWSRSGFKFEI